MPDNSDSDRYEIESILFPSYQGPASDSHSSPPPESLELTPEHEQLRTQTLSALVVAGHALTQRAAKIKQHWADIEELVVSIRKQLESAREELARIAVMAITLQREQELSGGSVDLNLTEEDRQRIQMGRQIAWSALERSLENILSGLSEGNSDPSEALEQVKIIVQTIVKETLENIS